MVSAALTIIVLGSIWIAALAVLIWISSLASLRLYRGLQSRATPIVLAIFLSALTWLVVFSFGWPVVGLWWLFKWLLRRVGPKRPANG